MAGDAQPLNPALRGPSPRPTAIATSINDRMKMMLSRYHARCRGNHVQYSTTASSKERWVERGGSGRRRVTDNWRMSGYVHGRGDDNNGTMTGRGRGRGRGALGRGDTKPLCSNYCVKKKDTMENEKNKKVSRRSGTSATNVSEDPASSPCLAAGRPETILTRGNETITTTQVITQVPLLLLLLTIYWIEISKIN